MKEHQAKGYTFIFIAGCLWGAIGLFVNLLGGYGASTGTMVFLRLLTGAMWIAAVMLATGGLKGFRIDKKGLLLCGLLGILCQAMFNYAYTQAIGRVGMATAAVLLYTSPIFVCVMSRIFFKEAIGRQKVAGLVVNIIGCVLTVTGGNLSEMEFSVFGVVIGVTAGFLYSLLTIFGTVAKDYDSMTVTFYSFLLGAVVMGAAADPWAEIASAASPAFVITALGYGLISTAGAYCIYMKGLSFGLETSKVPVIASVETVVAAVIGVAVLQEDFSLWKLAGIVLVLCSIAVMNLGGRKSE